MNRLIVTVILVGVTCLVGCDRGSKHVLASGKLVSPVTIWERPLGQLGENNGFPAPVGSRVDIYEGCIIVTTADGISHVGPNGFYTNLAFKAD